MPKRLYVGNLSQDLTDQELGDFFAAYGEVLKAEVVIGRRGKVRGFGYVALASDEEAARAILELNGRELQGQAVTVAEARSRPRLSPMEEANRRAEFYRGYGSGSRGRRNRP